MNDLYVDDAFRYFSADDVLDYYTEASFAIREAELKMWHTIGTILSDQDEKTRRQVAKLIKKHLSEVETAIKFYEKYPDFEAFPFTKATTWSSLKKELGTKEKRQRKTLKEIVSKRYERNISEGRHERAEEDKDILNEVEADDEIQKHV